jgi:hypothetical protein
VVITATVTDASGVEWVEATVTGPNRATVPVRLTSEGNNLYRGTFPAPANPHSDGKADVYTVHLRARDKAKTPNETPSPGEKADDFQVNAPESPPEKPPTF